MSNHRLNRLGEENVLTLLLTFSAPAIVGTLSQAIYNVVDRIFVGRAVGADGIAAVTVALPYMMVLLAFGMLIGFGATTLVSIKLGQQKRLEAERVLGNAALLLVALSLMLTVVGLALLDPILIASGASPAVLPYARDYLQILVLGAVFQMIALGLNGILSGEGSPKAAMATTLVGVLLNTVLTPLFIFQFGWGIRGAAVGTVLSQAVSAIFVSGWFAAGKGVLRFHARNLRLDPALCWTMLAVGSPLFIMQLMTGLTNGLLNQQLRAYGGDPAISVMGIIYVVFTVIAMPILGINQAAQPIIGYNFGARKFDRVKQTLQAAILAAVAIATFGFAVTMLFPLQVIRLFDGDAALAEMGVYAMRISLMLLPVVGFQIVGASYFQAVGKPKHALSLHLSRQVFLFIPALLVLPWFFGLDGVWLAMPVSTLISTLLTAVWLAMELRCDQPAYSAAPSGE